MELLNPSPLSKNKRYDKHYETGVEHTSSVGMRAVSVFLFAGFALSSCTPPSSFRYELSRSFRRDLDSCRICYGDDCTVMKNNRCRYYVHTDDIIEKELAGGDVTDIDAMMYDLTELAVKSWTMQACIPMISAYTNCNKDNICVGCQSCRCNKDGHWECDTVHRCKPGGDVDANHRVLEAVIDRLTDQEKLSRKKRAVTKDHDARNVSLSDIAEWMYGVKPFNDRVLVNTTSDGVTDSTHIESTTPQPSNTFTKTDSEYLDFEEVLKNIGIDDQNYNRRKSQLKLANDTNFDYMDIEYYNINNRSNSSDIFDALSALEIENDVKETTDSSTTFVIDLIPREYRNDYYEYNDTSDDADTNKINYKEGQQLDISNETIELNAINIMKRDTSMSLSTEPSISTVITASTSSTQGSTSSNINIYDNILIPLTTVIDDKKEEIKELIEIKENLINFINAQNISAFNVTNTTDYINGNNSNVYFSFYNLDLLPEMQKNFRRSDTNLQEKLLYKLNRDIHEVLKDVNYIQKTTKIFGLPEPLKIVVNALKRYMYIQKKNHSLASRYPNFHRHKNYRRFWSQPKDISINGQLIEIFSILDKKKPKSNAMARLSRAITKIMKRIIKQNYDDELPNFNGMVYERLFNLSIYLKVIGKDWPHLTANIAASPPSERLHAMKLLHFSMIEDINRIVDAKALVEFAQTRRVNPVESTVAEEVMDKISDGLSILQDKIVLLIKHHSKSKKDILRTVKNIEKKSKKESFFRKIKNLLRGSKHDLVDILKKKAHDKEIVNSLMKPEDTNYERTMLKWQKYLSMATRKKRDLKSRFRKLKNTIKGIIPKYLQGKINPALSKSHKAKKLPDSNTDGKIKNKNQRPVTKPIKIPEHNTLKSNK